MSSSRRCTQCKCPVDEPPSAASEPTLCRECSAADHSPGDQPESKPESTPPAPSEASLFDAIERQSRQAAQSTNRSEVIPDKRVEFPTCDWPDHVRSTFQGMLSEDSFGEPLLVRPWLRKNRIVWPMVGCFATSVLFFHLLFAFVREPDFPLVAPASTLFSVLVAASLVGLFVAIGWPIWKRWLESERGFEFGDYIWEFGLVEARPTEVVIRLWDSVSIESDFNDERPVNLRTAGAFDVPLEEFEGNLECARERLDAYQRDQHLPPELYDLVIDDELHWTDSLADLRRGFFAPLVIASTALATAVGFTGGPVLQDAIQTSQVDKWVDEYQQSVERLRDHDPSARDDFRAHIRHCDELLGFSPPDFSDGSPGHRFHSDVCDQSVEDRPLTRFERVAMHRHLQSSSPAHEDVITERLRLDYEDQIRQMERRIDTDSTPLSEFALRLLRKFVDAPDTAVELAIQPVISAEFKSPALMAEYFELDQPVEFVDEATDPDQTDGKPFVSPASLLSGHQGLNVISAPRTVINGFLDTLVGHTDFPVELSRVSAPLFSDQHIDREDLTALFEAAGEHHESGDEHNTDPIAPDEDNHFAVEPDTSVDVDGDDEIAVDPKTGDGHLFAPHDLVASDTVIDDAPDVDRPTIRVVYEVMPGPFTIDSPQTHYRYPSVRIRGVIQWISPDDGVVWAFDSVADLPEERTFDFDVDFDHPAQIYGQLYNEAFSQFSIELVDEIAF